MDVQKFLESLTPEQKAELISGLTQTTQETSYKRNPPEKKEVEGLFVMNKTEQKVKRMPVSESKKTNTFIDTGTEHKDDQNKTPAVGLTERRRPSFQRVEQVCNRCNKSFKVHPQHARDFFVCDSCLKR